MTDSDYQSIGVSILGDRKKLLYLFQKQTDEKPKEDIQKEPEEEYIDIERDGKEYCIKKDEPEILLCRKYHKRVFFDATL